MSSIRFETASTLKVVADLLAQHGSDMATFRFKANALKLQCMDNSHSSLLDFVFDEPFFLDYDCSEETWLTLRPQTLSKALGIFASTQPLHITFGRSADLLVISQESEEISRDFSLKLVASIDQAIEVPTPEQQFTAEHAASEFLRACTFAKEFGESVAVAGPPVTFTAKGFDVSAHLVCMPQHMRKSQEKTRSVYSAKHMLNFAKACAGIAPPRGKPSADTVSLSFNEQGTLYALCKLPRGSGRLRMCLAARTH